MDENFETIYEDHFSEETKEAFTYDDYVVRHEHLYDVLHVENLNISFASETEPISQEDLELLTAYEIPIHISFQTLAGEVEFENLLELTRPLPEEEEADEEANEQQEDRWYVNWDTTFILPGLGPNDEVRYQSTPGERGDIIDRNGNPIATTG